MSGFLTDNYRAVFWDFDGVILRSNEVRTQGFRHLFRHEDPELVRRLIEYHEQNGGLSRYVKIRYFYEVLRQMPVSDEQVFQMADEFSVIMREQLTNPELLIEDSVAFIRAHHLRVPMYVVSGSDEAELNYLCRQLQIDGFFRAIKGSPTPKIQLVASLLEQEQLPPEQVLLIGDSVNDWDAARKNQIHFAGYNQPGLKGKGDFYINRFTPESLCQ